jgi:hypothetical protein
MRARTKITLTHFFTGRSYCGIFGGDQFLDEEGTR